METINVDETDTAAVETVGETETVVDTGMAPDLEETNPGGARS